MAPDKSLAAEIEAVLRERIWAHSSPAGSVAQIHGIPEAAADIAALQSRAFEDRARWMRERAQGCAAAWRVRPEKAFRAGFSSEQIRTRNDAADRIAMAIAALPLQPEGERNNG